MLACCLLEPSALRLLMNWSSRLSLIVTDHKAVVCDVGVVKQRSAKEQRKAIKKNMEPKKLNPDQLAPESQYRLLTEKDLAGKTPKELTLMRNEIYARHGRPFKRRDLREYFLKKPWYKPDRSYRDSRLNDIERKNAAFILRYQKNHGKMY